MGRKEVFAMSHMSIRIAGLVRESVVDGPGLRFVVFAQGCTHCCPGCHNPETWDPSGGENKTVSEILAEIDKTKLIKGVTFTGGEPFLQAAEFAVLGRAVKERGLDLITYTGYTWEQLQETALSNEYVDELLRLNDFIIDGPFVEKEKDLNLPFRGSKNQRIIDVQKSLSLGTVVEMSFGIAS